jgi:hypothetical protein
MSQVIILLLLLVGFLFYYASGEMGGVPKLIKTLEDEDFKAADFDCDKGKTDIKKLLEHEEGDALEIDLLFEHVYKKNTLEEIQAKLLLACPDALKKTTEEEGDGVQHCRTTYQPFSDVPCIDGTQTRTFTNGTPGPGGRECWVTPQFPLTQSCTTAPALTTAASTTAASTTAASTTAASTTAASTTAASTTAASTAAATPTMTVNVESISGAPEVTWTITNVKQWTKMGMIYYISPNPIDLKTDSFVNSGEILEYVPTKTITLNFESDDFDKYVTFRAQFFYDNEDPGFAFLHNRILTDPDPATTTPATTTPATTTPAITTPVRTTTPAIPGANSVSDWGRCTADSQCMRDNGGSGAPLKCRNAKTSTMAREPMCMHASWADSSCKNQFGTTSNYSHGQYETSFGVDSCSGSGTGTGSSTTAPATTTPATTTPVRTFASAIPGIGTVGDWGSCTASNQCGESAGYQMSCLNSKPSTMTPVRRCMHLNWARTACQNDHGRPNGYNSWFDRCN